MINQKALTEGNAAAGRLAWYLVATKAGKERLAIMQLRMQGFETYLPMRAPMKAGGEAKPLFPAYLFVRVDLEQPGWRAIYSTIGVKDVVSTGYGDSRKPRAMPRGLVPGFMALEREGLIPLAKAMQREAQAVQAQAAGVSAAPVPVGDRVMIPFGVAGGVIAAVVTEHVDARRIGVLFSFLGRDSRATVDLASVVRSSAVAVQQGSAD